MKWLNFSHNILFKFDIIKKKEFNLSDYVNSSNRKCRILKYDSYNDLIEQSYVNENSVTVFEALGFTKYPYNMCWYLEILPSDEQFLEYNSNDFNIKLVNLNIRTFEASDLFNLRVKGESTVSELRKMIAQKLKCDENLIRMALEKSNSLCNYIYLNRNFDERLNSQHFGRVNKVFLEYEDDNDLNKKFENSKFCYALDAIINMLQTTVYLPSEEDCDIFLRKIKRHDIYMENLNKKRRIQNQDSDEVPTKLQMEENTIDSYSYETIGSVQSTVNTFENDNNSLPDKAKAKNDLVMPSPVPVDCGDEVSVISDVVTGSAIEEASSCGMSDSVSRMSVQIEEGNHLNWVKKYSFLKN